MQSYRDLEVWQRAVDLVEEIYRLCKRLPSEERFGLISQMQRAAISIPANIAEGYGRGHRAEYLQYLPIGRGSLMEIETHLIITHRLGFLTEDEIKET